MLELDERAWLGFATALGAGLLIGIERERRKGSGRNRAPAGVRTFAVCALIGAASAALAVPAVMAAAAALVMAISLVAYARNRSADPGATTALALLLTFLLGALAMRDAVLAGGSAVVVTALLASRHSLHRFSVNMLTEAELRDALVFAGATLILLPWLPSRDLDWLPGVNPRRLWTLVVLFMALQAAGYVALRIAGARLGLALSGFGGGFVSSTGTIATLGTRARSTPALRRACVSGALLSNLATLVLLALVCLAVWPAALAPLASSLALAALAIGGAVALSGRGAREPPTPLAAAGRPFNLLHATGFALLITTATLLVGFAVRRSGTVAAAAVAGLAGAFDVHAAAASTLSLAAQGMLGAGDARRVILIAFSANTLVKALAAQVAGGRRFALPVTLGLLAMLVAAWLPWWLRA